MAYIEDFLTNNFYRFISILFGFAFVFFTGIFYNYDRYYYLTSEQVINNSTNEYNDDDDTINYIDYVNNTNSNTSYINTSYINTSYINTAYINFYDTVYDNSTLWRCEKILNTMHYYRVINAIIYTILFMFMGCFNFKILENRRYFCKIFAGGTIINLFLGSIILLSEGIFKCFQIINEQYKYMQIITIINYLIMILILVVFAEDTYKKNRRNREIEFNNNQNINNNNFENSAYPPKYSENKDKPPSYQENYIITISPSAPLLQNRE
jgi:hypothetical protein